MIPQLSLEQIVAQAINAVKGRTAARLIGLVVRDEVLRRDEVTELETGLMRSAAAPTGTIRLAGWLAANGDALGRHWSSELDRHFRGR